MNYYTRLKEIKESNPNLTYQNDGYDNIPKEILTADDLEKLEEIKQILTETVKGFVRFQNFKDREDGSFHLRMQTQWSPFFIGVTYIHIEKFKNEA